MEWIKLDWSSRFNWS